MVYIGIDPGKTGGIGLLDSEVEVYSMPSLDAALLDLLGNKQFLATCCIEDVGPMPRQGVVSMFTFGRELGRVRMAATACGHAITMVKPKVWQKELGLATTKKESYAERKRRFLRVAKEMFPLAAVTLQTADALLIAEFCRRLYGRS